MNNLEIRQAESVIIGYVNNLPFCLEIKRLLLKDVYERISEEANRAVDKEYKEQEVKDGTKNVSENTVGE